MDSPVFPSLGRKSPFLKKEFEKFVRPLVCHPGSDERPLCGQILRLLPDHAVDCGALPSNGLRIVNSQFLSFLTVRATHLPTKPGFDLETINTEIVTTI